MVKPVHPAAVHFPIAFLVLGYGLDIMHSISPRLPKSFTSSLPPPTDITRASYYLISLGLIMAVPALVTGIREAVVSIGRQGLFESDQKTGASVMREKFKPMIAHAVFNYVHLGLGTLVWYLRRRNAKTTFAGKMGLGSASTAQAAYAPAAWMVVIEGICFVVVMMAANIGGVLAYNFGMGQSIGGGAKKKQ